MHPSVGVKWLAKGLVAGAACIYSLTSAQAEVTTVTIGETFGLTHLASYVVADEHLIEAAAQARGLPPIKVDFKQVSNGNVVADLLLSGSVNVASSGVVPFLSLADKVKRLQPIKGIAALAGCNDFLMTTDPNITSIKDFKDTDRIAMTDVAATTWAILLQIEAAKLYGWDNRNRFTPLSVPMANGEAAAAMLSGRTEVKSHMTMLPYTAVERQSGHIRAILSSKDVVGTPITAAMVFTTVKFHDENPSVYAAIADAYEQAEQFINEHPREAAEIYIRHEPQKEGVAGVLKMMQPDQPDELVFTTTPQGVKAFADYMARAGLIKEAAPSWGDFFFENLHDKQGS
jgi:NitT/TauT family transport system substrate-binding protein